MDPRTLSSRGRRALSTAAPRSPQPVPFPGCLPDPEGNVPADQAGAEDAGEDPHSPGGSPAHRTGAHPEVPSDPVADSLQVPLAFLGGFLIALLTVMVPLASVVGDRRGLPSGSSPTLPVVLSDGPSPPPPVAVPARGDRGAGASRWQRK